MEDNSTPAPSLMQQAIRWGLIIGAISIIFTLLLYAIDYTLMVQMKFAFLGLAIYLGITIYSGIEYRKSVGGFLAYGKAWQHGFIVLALSGLVVSIFNILLYNVIDAELPQKLVDASMENTRALMESFGTPEDAMDEALEKARESTAGQFTVAGIAKGYIIMVVVSAVLALISALIVRKNKPELM
jgi:Protein of unknown function (DUF4199)